MTMQNSGKQGRDVNMNRRQFGVGAATLSFSLMGARAVAQTEANSKVKLGLLGCGGRGTWIAGLFKAHGGYEIVAGADYFADRATKTAPSGLVPANGAKKRR